MSHPTNTSKGSSTGELNKAYSSGTEDTPRQIEHIITEDKDNASTVSTEHAKQNRCVTCLRSIRMELLAFIFTFSYNMPAISSTTMIIDKVCLVHFGYNQSVCDNLHELTENETSIKIEVGKLATNYQLVHSLIMITPAAVLACFVGPWSDHYGRKFPMVLAIVGMIIHASGSAICAHFLETRVEYYLIPVIFMGVFGGPVVVMAIFYSCASDSTPQMGQRTKKYAFMDMAMGFSAPFGQMAGGWIFKFLGYTAVFYFSIGCLCLSLLIVVFLLEETRGLDNDDHWSTKLKRLFSCKSLVESYHAVIKVRPHQGRKQLILLILSLTSIVITLGSTGDINYLFARHQFGWSNPTFSTINSIYSALGIVVIFIVVPLMKRYSIGDPLLGLIGSASLLGKNIGMALAWKEGIYHIGRLVGILGNCASFAARARISKVVSKDDVGKVFSFVAASESFVPILASILMSQLFAAFLDTFPGMPYLALSLFLVLPTGVFCWMKCSPKLGYEDKPQTQEIEVK